MGVDTELVHEGGHCYIMHDLEHGKDYRTEMLAQNDLKHFVKAEIRQMNSVWQVYYDISSYLSIEMMFKGKTLALRDVERILRSVEDACREAEEYLLPPVGLVTDPAYVFSVKEDMERIKWLYCQDETADTDKLAEFLMNNIDYNDKEAVRIVYTLYQRQRERTGDMLFFRDCCRELLAVKAERREPPREEIRMEYRPVNTAGKEKRSLLKEAATKALALLGIKGANDEQCEIRGNEDPESKIYEGSKTVVLTNGMTDGGLFCLKAQSRGDEDILITEYPFFLGKIEGRTDYVFDDGTVSRYHARIDKDDENCYVTDLNSANGTFINRVRIKAYEKKIIKEGDSIIFSRREYVLKFLR